MVGGGIVGLWIARLATQQGMRVVLLEKNHIGAGASGGFLGALMPHMPDQWNPKKQFQFEALVSLEKEIADIEKETGTSCGYRRCGRLMPLAKPHHADLAAARRDAAVQNWSSDHSKYSWTLRQDSPIGEWPSEALMPHGVVHDTLAARVSPRRYLKALFTTLEPSATILQNEGLDTLGDQAGIYRTSRGRQIAAERIVLAAGYQTFELLESMLGAYPHSTGRPVKGQAALLKADVDAESPLVFHDGIYVVPHDDGLVAVGSTSENSFQNGFETDENLDVVIERAEKLCPALKDAQVIERWANLRPKAKRRDPMIGTLPDREDCVVATGGFKITFGIAHKMARCALEIALDGRCGTLPKSFQLQHHLT